MKVSPSILAGSLCRMHSTVAAMDPSVIDLLHMDVMDGHFVPQLSYGEAYVAEIKSATDIPLDVHLMVSAPEKEVPKYFGLKPYNITFHIEATAFAVRLLCSIREQGIRSGIALNPGTPIAQLKPLIPYTDLFLLMSIEPGYYGQSFLPASFDRIRELRDMAPEAEIEVDGGINAEIGAQLAALGVDILVAGSYIFKGGDVNGRARTLKGL
ncbi:MAG: ribulose-phosphate 3-epimerase [Spirochaetales bacterium]|nr:ribulose-phosphate 3-epimerase [Spirochaetales bacterium]